MSMSMKFLSIFDAENIVKKYFTGMQTTKRNNLQSFNNYMGELVKIVSSLKVELE